jgi:hypothetical protein
VVLDPHPVQDQQVVTHPLILLLLQEEVGVKVAAMEPVATVAPVAAACMEVQAVPELLDKVTMVDRVVLV